MYAYSPSRYRMTLISTPSAPAPPSPNARASTSASISGVVLVVGGVPISDWVDRDVSEADDSDADRSASDMEEAVVFDVELLRSSDPFLARSARLVSEPWRREEPGWSSIDAAARSSARASTLVCVEIGRGVRRSALSMPMVGFVSAGPVEDGVAADGGEDEACVVVDVDGLSRRARRGMTCPVAGLTYGMAASGVVNTRSVDGSSGEMENGMYVRGRALS